MTEDISLASPVAPSPPSAQPDSDEYKKVGHAESPEMHAQQNVYFPVYRDWALIGII